MGRQATADVSGSEQPAALPATTPPDDGRTARNAAGARGAGGGRCCRGDARCCPPVCRAPPIRVLYEPRVTSLPLHTGMYPHVTLTLFITLLPYAHNRERPGGLIPSLFRFDVADDDQK